MSETRSIGAAPAAGSEVHSAIARAANRTGVDFDYLLAQARIESSLDPKARAATSSAAGLYQFTQGTWLQTLGRHGAGHGLGWAQTAIGGGLLRDPAMRAQVMALRFDPDASSAMAAELASDNRDALTPVLGREPDAAELYLAHFLGAGGARQFLSALQTDPGQSAAGLLPRAAAANRGIFFDSGAPRSVGAVMELLRGKISSAMGPGADPFPGSPPGDNAGWIATGRVAPSAPPSLAATLRPSMADTLRDTFGLASADGHASAPGFVRAAYGDLRSLGL